MKNKLSKALISAVIPAYNEESVIKDCLESLLNQSYKNLEIIVIDDGSIDSTREIVKKFKKVKLVHGEHKGPGFSRNLGAKIAKGKILVFVDADMAFDKKYIEYLVSPILEGKSIGTEERFQKASNLNNVWSRCWGSYVSGDRKNKENKGIVFRAILKSKFLEMGGFDSKYGYADDLTFFFKYGVLSDLADNALCFHKNPESLEEIYKQSRWIGASRFVYYPILGKKAAFPLIFILGIPALIPLTFYLFLRRILTKRFIPEKPEDLISLLLFSFVKVYGTFVGILRRNLKGFNYR